jgi:transposase
MLPQHTSPEQSPRSIGVGIDTARYGHYAVFLKDDLQPAADELAFAESAAGYALLQQRLQDIVARYRPLAFAVRLDVAGPYADNLLHFLHQLATANADAANATAPLPLTISCGDPQRNKNYRVAFFGSQKSDPVEARAAARYAVSERTKSDKPLSPELRILRQVAGRLQAVVRQRTRLLNQFHHLLALTFPELALLTKDVAAGWVLELIHRYPNAACLAQATPAALAAIPYLPDEQVTPLLQQAHHSVASLTGAAIDELVRDQVRQLRDSAARQKRLESLLVCAYRALPQANHLDSIPGIGAVTAAVLTAFLGDIDRFATPGKLVAYFGVLPIEASSGVDRDGQPRSPRRWVMSRRGNDLVRRYLWMAALSALRCNPAVRALYSRVVAKHPQHKAVAVGHAMRKLLHLVFAICKSGRPFDRHHYPWQTPAHVETSDKGMSAKDSSRDNDMSVHSQAAGHKPEAEPAQPVVTAACADSVVEAATVGESAWVDFAHVQEQLSLAQVLDQLGLSTRLRGNGPQRRGPCPLHRGDGRGRTFSVNLEANVFQCFDKQCGQQGDVIDLWAALHGLSLREAALDLVRTFGLEPSSQPATEKRNG